MNRNSSSAMGRLGCELYVGVYDTIFSIRPAIESPKKAMHSSYIVREIVVMFLEIAWVGFL